MTELRAAAADNITHTNSQLSPPFSSPFPSFPLSLFLYIQFQSQIANNVNCFGFIHREFETKTKMQPKKKRFLV